MTTIRPLERSDYAQWLSLWQENCAHQIADDVTAETWRRLTHLKEPVHGLVAEQDGRLIGLVHYILHATTGHIAPVCYMQDVFVVPAFRRQGIGRQLVWALRDAAQKAGWARLYWIAANDNPAAQALYKSLGIRLDFGFYVLPTDQG